MNQAAVIGTGSYLPEIVITNKDLEGEFADGPGSRILTDAWIKHNFGIRQRHLAYDYRTGEKKEMNSDMAAKAAKAALASAGIGPEDVEMLISTTATPDQQLPPMVLTVQEKLGIRECAFIETRSACSGVAQAMLVANELIRGGIYRTILLVGSEFASAFYDVATYSNHLDECINRVMFGDGAGALVLQAADNHQGGILACILKSVGYGKAPGIDFPFGGSQNLVRRKDQEKIPYVRQNFKAIAASAPALFKKAMEDILAKAHLKVEDVSLFIVHQASIRYLDYLMQEFNIPSEKMMVDLDRVGNTGSASIYIALDRAVKERRLKKGDIVVLLPAEATKWVFGGVALRWTASPN